MIDWNGDPELAELRREFVASFGERKRALSSIIGRMGNGEAAEELAGELRVIAHNLAGAAGTYGFSGIGKLAAEIDDRFSAEAAESPAAAQVLEDARRLLQELISCAESPASAARS